jgi:hypothetical protein
MQGFNVRTLLAIRHAPFVDEVASYNKNYNDRLKCNWEMGDKSTRY